MAMGLAPNMAIPRGFRYRPTESELMTDLKLMNLVNDPRVDQFLPTIDLAEFDPWEIRDKLKMPWEDTKCYFSYKREKLRGKGNQFSRKGKSGFWKSTCEEEEIVDGETGECIGKKRILVFHKGRYPGERTDWVNHEYALNNLLPDQSASFVIGMLKKKTMKTENTKKSKRARQDADIPEKTKKLKRAKKGADIPESLEGEPSGNNMSDLDFSVPPALIEHGYAESNYGSISQQNLPYFNKGGASYTVTSNSEISPAANLVVDDYAIDSAQPLCSTEGHKDMPTSYGLAESEKPIEELLDCFYVPDENISGKTTDGTFDESSQQKSLEMPTSYGFDEPDEFFGVVLKSFAATEDISGNTLDGIINLSSQQTSSEMLCFPDYPVSSNMDAEGVDGSFWQQNLPHLNEGEASFTVTSNSEISPTANLVVDDYAIYSAQPLCSTEGHKDMPTSYGLAESEEPVEELMDRFFVPDENISGKTTDGIFNEFNQQKSLEMPTSYGFDVPEESITELLERFIATVDNMSGNTLDGNFNLSSQQTSLEMLSFPGNPVSSNTDAEGVDGQVNVLGPLAPGG